MVDYLDTTLGKLAYCKHVFAESKVGVVFLGGLRSDMGGTKALALEAFCQEQRISFLRFDYMGHGMSDGEFTDGTIGVWKQNVLDVLDQLTEGPQVLVGSSLGGWLMVLAARERRERVAALVGVAVAPDFTEELMWEVFDADARAIIEREGAYEMPSEYSDCPYTITRDLIEDGRRHLVLREEIPIMCPVRLLHGMKDDDVPYAFSYRLAEQLASLDVEVLLEKGGDHRMSSEYSIGLLAGIVKEVIARCS